MRVFISQPMNGRKDQDIKIERAEIVDKFNKMDIEVVDSYIKKDAPKHIKHPEVYYLGRGIYDFLHSVDAVYFADGWEQNRGCRIEHQICMEYGIKCLYSDFFTNDIPMIRNNNITITTCSNNIDGVRAIDTTPKISW